ncbi:MAG: DUF4132 domain-containing protein [Polyangiaceae bacterium]
MSLASAQQRLIAFHRRTQGSTSACYPHLFDLLVLLFSFDDAVTLLLDVVPKGPLAIYAQRIPTLDPAEHPAAHERVLDYQRALDLSSAESLQLAALLFLIAPEPRVLRRFLDGVEANAYPGIHQVRFAMNDLLMLLDDPNEITERAERLAGKQGLQIQADLLERLAYLGHYNGIARLLSIKPSRCISRTTLEALSRIHSASLTPPLLSLSADGLLGATADHWLAHEGANAIQPLFREATRRGKQRKHAGELLQSYLHRGHEPLIRKLLDDEEPALQQAVANELGLTSRPDTSNEVAEDVSESDLDATHPETSRVPSFSLDTLAPLMTRDGKRASHRVAQAILEWLSAWHESDEPPTGIPMPHALRLLLSKLTPQSIDHFCQQVLELFKKAGSPKTDEWVFRVAFLSPSDTTLFTMSRSARGRMSTILDSLSQRYLLALDRPTAYYLLASHASYGATQLLKEIARRRHESLDELLDGAAPTCGLSLDGARDFKIGSRTYTLQLSDRTLTLLDEKRHPIRAIPALKKGASLAEEEHARRELATCKELITGTLTLHASQLEKAMKEERIWAMWQWRTSFVDHPVLFSLVKALVWETCGAGTPSIRFRVAEDRTYASVDDTSVNLDVEKWVRLASPETLSPEERTSWAALFDEYKILQPFAQVQLATND